LVTGFLAVAFLLAFFLEAFFRVAFFLAIFFLLAFFLLGFFFLDAGFREADFLEVDFFAEIFFLLAAFLAAGFFLDLAFFFEDFFVLILRLLPAVFFRPADLFDAALLLLAPTFFRFLFAVFLADILQILPDRKARHYTPVDSAWKGIWGAFCRFCSGPCRSWQDQHRGRIPSVESAANSASPGRRTGIPRGLFRGLGPCCSGSLQWPETVNVFCWRQSFYEANYFTLPRILRAMGSTPTDATKQD
jgi:hypothetical protein